MSDTTGADEPLLRFTYTSPGLGLRERAEELARHLGALGLEADSISVVDPISGIREYRRLDRQRDEIRPEVGKFLGESVGALGSAVEGAPGFAAAALQAVSMGQALSATIQIQNQWQRFSGTIDRKAAFLVASTSIYISTVSLVATVVLGVLSLR